jgi:transposase
VKGLYGQMKEAQRVRTVPGFGEFFSVLVVTEIADISRFEDVGKLHAYAGIIPSTHSSGQRSYHGKIIKAGNRWLRWAAVEAVTPACRADFDIRLFYERFARRKGANVAKVATARRLLTIIYKILKEERAYMPYKRQTKKESAAL